MNASDSTPGRPAGQPRYLAPHLYAADPAAHVFDGRLYIYPSHDIDSGIPESDHGDHFDMRDYHVLSLESIDGEVTDHGVALEIGDVPWAARQLWDCDCAEKDGRYYLYFPAKDPGGTFRIGVALADRPEGPFEALEKPIEGSYSIDPCVFRDDDGSFYIYFGGLWGGQLQCYRDNAPAESDEEPPDDAPALCPRVARLSHNMLEFAQPPRDALIVDEHGEPLKAGDHARRFFEASWLHKHKGRYYFSYSTGDTHRICYAVGDNPYGPFTYAGVILTPVVGWTTHHAICEFKGTWYLFHHDCRPSGGRTWLRSMKVVELEYRADGAIETIQAEA